MKHLLCLLSLALIVSSNSVLASNVGGAHGPVINPEDVSFQYRLGVSPSQGEIDDRWVQRVHFQRAFDGNLRWRLVVQARDFGSGQSTEYDSARAELLWHFKQKGTGIWDSAVRFDLVNRRGNRSEQIQIHWTNQWQFSARWKAVGLLIGSWDIAGNKNSGTFVSTRSSLTYKLDSGQNLGIEMFNNYGKASDMGSFNQQNHSIGPMLSGKIGGYGYNIGYHAGISNGAPDHAFRFWLSKSF